MKLEFLFVPTSDLRASLGLYRDGLGFTEVWREGDATVALALPGSDVQLMLDSHDPDAPIGPLFVVDSVDKHVGEIRPRSDLGGRTVDDREHDNSEAIDKLGCDQPSA
jgi:catechol 2,3-dioxygenase-like lactoylglutathione lyase family enzyme